MRRSRSTRWRSITPSCPQADIIAHATAAWDGALALGEAHGYRNAQTTVVAPTGTIGLVMDCDTTGIRARFRAGEIQEALPAAATGRSSTRRYFRALRVLGYRESEIAEIEAYAVGHGSLSNSPGVNASTLMRKRSYR